ncbi:MAG: DUF4203 domain-containing protein [Acidobacteria bacterium]|nr:DUF4203 domain-containing protein [Acidobacteriota bacterium]
MLPASYAAPAAAIITLGGVLACFFGYRLFRLVLGIYGFVAGAMIATQMMGPSSSVWTLSVAAVVGGVVGGALMIAAYFIGVGLVGAGLAALALNLGWRLVGGEPPTWLLVVVAVLGALGALSVARLVVILGTATAGAWTIIVGALALMGDRAATRAARTGDVWILYPLDPLPERWWYTVGWVALLVVGAIVQLSTSTRGGRSRARKRKAAA